LPRLVGLLTVLVSSPLETFAQTPDHSLTIGEQTIRVELALTAQEQTRGLMFRSLLPADSGMLFVYPSARIGCMWMKNTLIPLSVAFLDDKGEIINIADMKPLSRRSHCSKRPASYALEMNQGWFRKHRIAAGEKVLGLDQIPR